MAILVHVLLVLAVLSRASALDEPTVGRPCNPGEPAEIPSIKVIQTFLVLAFVIVDCFRMPDMPMFQKHRNCDPCNHFSTTSTVTAKWSIHSITTDAGTTTAGTYMKTALEQNILSAVVRNA